MTGNHAPLLDTLATVSVQVDRTASDGGIDWTRIPAQPGLVLFEDENRKTILIRAIGDARAFVRRRLDPSAIPDEPSARTDFAAITRVVRIIPTGFTLLAELLVPLAEATLDPAAAELTARRLSGCLVCCDPTARLPMFSTVPLAQLWSGEHSTTPHEHLIGPFSTPKHAQRWTETVIDLFDLCRYDHLMAQTPNATACVYKQMGKCPAPCDGSEPIESYRQRFATACRFYGGALHDEIDRCQQEMQTSSDQLDFEQAADLKKRCDAITSLSSGGPWSVGEVLRGSWELTGSAPKSGWTRTATLGPAGLHLHADHRNGHSPSHTVPPPIATGRIAWLMLDVLLDRLRKGLLSDETATQTEFEPAPRR